MNDVNSAQTTAPRNIVQTLGIGVRVIPWWRKWWVILPVIAMTGYVGWSILKPAPPVDYVLGHAEVATIRSVVTATGTLQPIDKVTVGAEVSGRIDDVLADFNDRVTKGQIIARINTDELKARAVQAQATVAQFSAALSKAENDLRRAVELKAKGFVSASAYDAALAARNSATANLNSARAQADQTQANLAKAAVRSPIDGVVLDRKIERGQTVAAGFQTPELFVIASDLRTLELTIDIDEADIGDVALAQEASFTVDAFPAQTFKAKVTELRNAARTIQNVVTYQGVLSVENDKGLLKPGMTATADIVVKIARDVMSVPNGALRFTPQVEEVTSMVPVATMAPTDPITSGKGKLWSVVQGAKPTSREVTLGITDGQRTQVTSANVKTGEDFIQDIAQPARPGTN